MSVSSIEKAVAVGHRFHFSNAHEGVFYDASRDVRAKGFRASAYLSKPVSSKVGLVIPELNMLNGFCKWGFLQDDSGICGALVVTPSFNTRVTPFFVCVGKPAESYKTMLHLQPQGLLILEAADSSTLFISDSKSPLVVKVDL